MSSLSFASRIALSAALLLPLGALAQTPTITATKSDGTPAATKKNPGDTVTYTNVISNTGTANATGVQFTDPDVTGAAVQMGTLKVSPIAFDDTYTGTIVSGVPMDTSVSTQFSAVTNDYVGIYNNAPGVLTITAFDATSANGGTVSMVTSGPNVGKFGYTSAGGFSGPDSFHYTISNTGFTATGTVNLTVSGPGVWFVNDATGDDTTGKGTMTLPYKTLTKVATVDAASQRIFVFSGAYTAGMTLEANEQIFGQGVVGISYDAVVTGITPGSDTSARPTIGGTKPTITTTSGNVITLGNNNVIRGVAINSTVAGFGVAGTAISTLQLGSSGGSTASDTTVSSSSASSGCVSLTGAAGGTVNILAVLSNSAAAGRAFTLSNRSSGAVSVIGKVSDTGNTGLSLNSNTGATINLRSLTLNNGGGTSLSATAGGTINLTAGDSDSMDNDGDGSTDEADEANTLANSAGSGLVVANTTIGASNLTFRSIAVSGTSGVGISLDTTGSSGGLIVTGDGANTALGGNGTGGTIGGKTGADQSRTSGIGIYLNNTINVSLSRMVLSGTHQNFGIRGNNVSGFSLAYSTVSGTFGTNLTNITGDSYGEGAIYFGNNGGASADTDAGSGNFTFTSNVISGGIARNLSVVDSDNTGGDLRLNVINCSFGLTQNVVGNHNLALETRTAGTVSHSTVQGCTFAGQAGDNINFTGQTGTTQHLIVGGAGGGQANTLSNTHAQNIVGGGSLTLATSGIQFFDVRNNVMTGANGSAVTIFKASTGTQQEGVFDGNTIGTSGVANSGAATGNGIFFSDAGAGTVTVSITNNTIQRYANAGIYADNTGGSYAVNLTITGNTVRQPAAAAFAALGLTNGAPSSADTTNVFARILNNDFSTGDPSNGSDILIGASGSSAGTHTFTLSGATATDVASLSAIQTFLQNNNNLNGAAATTVASAYIDPPVTVSQFKASAALPPTPTAPTPLLFAPGGIEKAAPAAPLADASTSPAAASPIAAPAQPQAPAAQELPLLTQDQLTSLVAVARQRWDATGLTAAQQKRLDSLTFEVANLDGLRLGEADGLTIRVDADGGTYGWYAGAGDDAFASVSSATRRYAPPSEAPAGRLDLLTALLHEMGHTLGLDDSYLAADRDNLMYGFLTKGERRLPAMNQAQGAVPHEDGHSHFLTGSVSIGVLPPGKSVTITYDVIINNPATTNTLSSQGTVSGGNFSNVLTDDLVSGGDPLLAGIADPTVTLIDLPDVTIAVSGSPVAEDSASAITYTFTRQGSTAAAMVVNFGLTGTASPASDYAVAAVFGALSYTSGATTGTITIPVGSATASITVTPTADTTVEANETVIVSVTTGSGYDVGIPGSDTGTITNDDTAISIDPLPDASLFEDQILNFSYTIRRLGVTTGTTTANFSVGGTATFGTDYSQSGATTFTTTTGSVTFAPGETTKVITLDPTNDNVVEGNETINLTVTSGTGYSIGSPASQIATIVDDDVTVTVTVSPATSIEDSGTGMVYTFNRTGGSIANALTVNLLVLGSADRTLDYTPSGLASFNPGTGDATITFSGGSATKTVTITPIADATGEPNETVTLSLLTNGTPAVTGGYSLGSPAVASGTILDDDTSVSIAVSPGSVGESSGTPMVYTFTRSGSTAAAQLVNFSVGGAATFTADYTASSSGVFGYSASSGTITIPVGQASASLSITPVTDDIVEADETAVLTVTAGSGYVPAAGPNNVATGTIMDDDTATVSIATITDGTEGPPLVNGKFRVTQTAVSSSNTTVNYSVSGTATPGAGNDYTTLTGSVTILAGNTTADIDVIVLADAVSGESTETVILTLSTFGSADPQISLGSPTTATVNITSGPVPITTGLGDVTTTASAPDATGASDGTQFDVLGRGGYLAANSTLGFPGTLKGPGVTVGTNDQGYWKDTGTGVKRLIRSGDAMPGAGGATLLALPTIPVPGLNSKGNVTLLANLRTGTGSPAVTASDDTAMWSEASGNGLQLLARENDPITSVSGAFINTFAFGCYATATTGAGTGEAAIALKMKGTTTDSAILRYSITGASGGILTATQTVIAREKAAAPGTAEVFGAMNSTLGAATRMDPEGIIAFEAQTKPSNKFGLWYQLPLGSTTKLYAAGDTAPGTSGATFSTFEQPSMGSGGTVAFRAFLVSDTGDNTGNAKNDGIWRGTVGGAFTPILRRGDAALPGMPVGSKVGNPWSGWLNLANHGAWRGWVDTAGNGISPFPDDTYGIYTDLGGTMRLLISVNDAAPGVAGATVATVDHPVVSGNTVGSEYVAFLGTLTGAGVTSTNNKAVWRSANGGTPTLLLRTGDSMVTSQGIKTVFGIDLPGSNMDIRPWELPVMDDTGRLLLIVTFGDGSTSQVIAQ